METEAEAQRGLYSPFLVTIASARVWTLIFLSLKPLALSIINNSLAPPRPESLLDAKKIKVKRY